METLFVGVGHRILKIVIIKMHLKTLLFSLYLATYFFPISHYHNTDLKILFDMMDHISCLKMKLD